jgi:hypothetical protein
MINLNVLNVRWIPILTRETAFDSTHNALKRSRSLAPLQHDGKSGHPWVRGCVDARAVRQMLITARIWAGEWLIVS